MRILTLVLSVVPALAFAQVADSVIFSAESQHQYSFFYSSYETIYDRNDAPYLYSASKELGLVVFDVSDAQALVPVDTFPPAVLNGLDLTNIHQDGNYLYASLGGFQGAAASPGLAIFNVSNPASIVLESVWDSTAWDNGSAVVITEGNYAYLGAMEDGILILDVSDKQNPQFVSQLELDLSWPGYANYDPNARGMDVRNDTLWVAFDAGGVRVVDCTDKSNPVQISQYINTALDGLANPAYNHILVKGNRAYVAKDFCGIELLDISDPLNIVQLEWYNPWNCNGASWFGSDGHTNEIRTDASENLLFVSAGATEVVVFDISNPDQLNRISSIAMVNDSAAVWGVDVWGDKLALSFINNSGIVLFQPYYSNFGGIKTYSWVADPVGVGASAQLASNVEVFPNPATEAATIRCSAPQAGLVSISLVDVTGVLVSQQVYQHVGGEQSFQLSTQRVASGLYVVQVSGAVTANLPLVVR